jgi:plastocyanin
MQGPRTLSSAVLRLLVPIRCATSQPGVQPRPTATSTPTETPAPLPTATPTASATATPLPLLMATPTPAAMLISATIQNVAFSPNPITIAPGSMVTWTNQDVVTHTVTADGSWGSSTLGPGGAYSHVFTSPGSYSYHCAIHLYMMGTVVVTP